MKLGCIFRRLVNESVTIKLKSGVSINGIILEIDKNMNVYLKNVKRTFKEEKHVFIREISIRGNSIRYIILPVWLNFETLLSI